MKLKFIIIGLLIVLIAGCSSNLPEYATKYGYNCDSKTSYSPSKHKVISCKIKLDYIKEILTYDNYGKIKEINFKINIDDETPLADGKYELTNCELRSQDPYKSKYTNLSHLSSCKNLHAEIKNNSFTISLKDVGIQNIVKYKVNGPYTLKFVSDLILWDSNFPFDSEGYKLIHYNIFLDDISDKDKTNLDRFYLIYETYPYNYSDFSINN